jgi:hypothetical protein
MNPWTSIELASGKALFCAVLFRITAAYHSSTAYPAAAYAPPHGPAAYPAAGCPLLTGSTIFHKVLMLTT